MSKKESRRFLSLFPEAARPLLAANGASIATQLGLQVVKDVVLDVLCGLNLRQSTEVLTRRRMSLLNAALVVTFARAQSTIPDFTDRIFEIATAGLGTNPPKADRWLLLWLLGLTDKGVQNILRDDSKGLDGYRERLDEVMHEVSKICSEDFGELTGEYRVNEEDPAILTWPFVLTLLSTIGSQTLAIRGSEKSMYGKLFERLVLASLLSILGYDLVDEPSKDPPDRVYWLTSRLEKRESDATLLHSSGLGVRFDIGFIGRGNPEITLDKVSRFEREIEIGRRTWHIATFIIVDRIGKRSKLVELAKNIDGRVFQMSLSYWPKQVAEEFEELFDDFEHDLTEMEEEKIRPYLRERLEAVPFHKLIEIAADVTDDDEDPESDD